jgi:hypothetical protein
MSYFEIQSPGQKRTFCNTLCVFAFEACDIFPSGICTLVAKTIETLAKTRLKHVVVDLMCAHHMGICGVWVVKNRFSLSVSEGCLGSKSIGFIK